PGNTPKLCRQFELGTSRNHLQPKAWFTYGCLLLQAGEIEKAELAFRRSAQLEPRNNYEAWTNLGHRYGKASLNAELKGRILQTLQKVPPLRHFNSQIGSSPQPTIETGRPARVIIEKYYTRLGNDFPHINKRVCEEVAHHPSKALRNKIAGFLTPPDEANPARPGARHLHPSAGGGARTAGQLIRARGVRSRREQLEVDPVTSQMPAGDGAERD
uniref:TPR_REGION domain-containing protein n=1 Tax=Macrostomum lignano TaxID=282301 RepID=A0A1I8FBY4_9PLAT